VGVVLKVLVYAAALWVAVALLSGVEFDGSALALVGIAVVMGVVNVTVRPVLKLLSLPFILVTLGLFLLVVNALALQIVIWVSDALDLGLTSEHFGWTMLAAIVVSLVTWGLEALLRSR